MKGVVFNLLEEIVTAEYGEDTWDTLLDGAGLDGAYTSLGSYSDGDLYKLVAVASEALDLPADDIVRWFGRRSMPLFAKSYPQLFEGHAGARPFVLTLNDMIHPEVRKIYPGADVPEFTFEPGENGNLLMGYRSPRRLCSFAEGLLEGSGDHFGEAVSIDQHECMKRGDDRCLLDIGFSSSGPTG